MVLNVMCYFFETRCIISAKRTKWIGRDTDSTRKVMHI